MWHSAVLEALNWYTFPGAQTCVIWKVMYPFESINRTMRAFSQNNANSHSFTYTLKSSQTFCSPSTDSTLTAGQTENLPPRTIVISPDWFLGWCFLNTCCCSEHSPFKEPLLTLWRHLTATEGNTDLRSWSHGTVTHIRVFSLEMLGALPQSPAKTHSCFSISSSLV